MIAFKSHSRVNELSDEIGSFHDNLSNRIEFTSCDAIILMGVSGSGKSTIGEMLAEELGLEFYDGDDFHPESNIEKMKAGRPLTDEDRLPWLQSLNKLIVRSHEIGKIPVVACSSLKRAYRDIICGGLKNVRFIYLHGSEELIEKRLKARTNHFFNPKLLHNQFLALEEPRPEEALWVGIELKPLSIIKRILNYLK